MPHSVACRIEIVPALLRILEDVSRDPERFASDGDLMIHIYAMYLLAQFRETRAYPVLVRIFSTPGELPFELAGDVVTEDLGRILASVSDGDVGGMTALVENEQANEYVRSAAMRGLLTLVACGKRTRDEVMAYLRSLFQKFDRRISYAWNALVRSCTELCPEEVVEEIRQAYEDGLGRHNRGSSDPPCQTMVHKSYAPYTPGWQRLLTNQPGGAIIPVLSIGQIQLHADLAV